MPTPKPLTIPVPDNNNPDRRVSALYLRPRGADRLLVLAHGAGAGMQHEFMEAIADRLAAAKCATLRYQFPYMEAGRGRPDRAPLLERTVVAAVRQGRRRARGLPLYAGGKSMGGRMTTRAASVSPLGVRGIALLGFPLHRPGDDSDSRADHLADVEEPMLFLQGTRDKLAELPRIRRVVRRHRKRAHLHVVDGADHGFFVLVRSGRTRDDVLDEMIARFTKWAHRLEQGARTR